MLVIHGAGGDHRHWPDGLHSIPDCDCMIVELPGHGKSGGSGRSSIEAYADFIESLVDGLQLDSVTLMGHSMGGAIAQTCGLRHRPWLRRLVLVGTGAKLRVAPDLLQLLDSDYKRAVDLICSRAFGASVSNSVVGPYRKGLLRTPSAVTRNDFRACDAFNLMEEVGEIRIPTLIVSGGADQLTPPKYGDYLQDRIPGASHTMIADAGHMLAIEKPVAFIEAVQAFMR